ncbi:MAG: hypothetical protein RJA99_2906 [Pseudomonadota bacterium]|jgi:hypothetical protein
MSPRLAALARTFAQPVSGPTYRPATRAVAAALVVALLGWGARSVIVDAGAAWDPTRVGAAAIVALALLWPMPMILFGRTVVDATGVRQLGWLGREVAWAEVVKVRFVAMPMSPRLMVSTGFGRARVFYSGDRRLDDALREAARLLTAPEEHLR